jgi:hypothetical protein
LTLVFNAAGRIWRPWNAFQYLPQHAWQLGNVHRDKESSSSDSGFVDNCRCGSFSSTTVGALKATDSVGLFN